ncbi:hypothetical protein D3C72_2331470 [compost metagenome]
MLEARSCGQGKAGEHLCFLAHGVESNGVRIDGVESGDSSNRVVALEYPFERTRHGWTIFSYQGREAGRGQGIEVGG